MPSGAKKRRAARNRKKIEAKNNDAAAAESSAAEAKAAEEALAAAKAEKGSTIADYVAEDVLSSINEVTSNVQSTAETEEKVNVEQTDATVAFGEPANNLIEGAIQIENFLASEVFEFGSKENEGNEELLMLDETVVKSSPLSEALKDNEETVVENVSKDLLVVNDTSSSVSKDTKNSAKADTETVLLKVLVQADELVAAGDIEENGESVKLEIVASDIKDQVEDDVLAKKVAESVLRDEVESAKIVANDILKQTKAFLSAEVLDVEGNFLPTSDVVNEQHPTPNMVHGAEEIEESVSETVTKTENVEYPSETNKEKPGVAEKLQEIKVMVEGGLLIADSMITIFLQLLDNLNAITDA